MYNILLTDDEQIVTDSLAFILEKNFPELCTIFKAGSGAEAIQACRQNKIDIIFMDINMPGINGLEAIGEIKQFNPSAVVIILSAFDKFQYAQEAMTLGAFRYLTKPVNRNLATQTVRNAMGIIDSVQGKLSSDIEIKEKLSFVSNIVESDFIYSSIYSPSDDRDLGRYLDYFKITEDSYFFICLELPATVGENQTRYECYMTLRDIISASNPCIVGPLMSNRVVAFVPVDGTGDEHSHFIWQQEFIRGVFTHLSMKISMNVKIGVGKISSDLSATVEAYNTALDALNTISDGGGAAFYYKTECAEKAGTEDLLRYEQHLLSRIAAGDVSGAKSQAIIWVNSIFSHSPDIDSVRNSVFKLLVIARTSVNEYRKGYSDESAFSTTFSILGNCSTKEDFENYLVPQIEDCAVIISGSKKNKENPVISKAKAYVEAHIGSEISLDQTADSVGVNPFYLSKLFKEETGSNFIDFVNDVRLEKARSLLKKLELSIKEVSFDCGYSDQNYFSKIFRRKFGITPTEYRNSL